MLNESKTINKYPDRDKFITNFAAIDWLAKRIKEVKKQGKPKRIALYKGITVDELLIEEPTVIYRSKGYFHSTVLARKNGLCIHDPKINLFTFPEFLTYIDPSKKFYNKPGVTKELTFHELDALVKEITEFPTTNEYALTKIAGSDKYVLIITGSALVANLDEIFDTLFDGYRFQKIRGYALEPSDKNYPTTEQTTIDGYVVGSITLNEILLKEQTVTIDIINLRVIKNVGGEKINLYSGDKYYNGEINYSGKS